MTTIDKIDVPYVVNSADIFSVIAQDNWPVWLDSGWLAEHKNFSGHHTDIIASNPIAHAVYDPHHTLPQSAKKHPLKPNDPGFSSLGDCFECIENTLDHYQHAQPNGPGWIGYLSYDLFNEFENIPKKAKTEHIPELVLGFYAYTIVNDHKSKSTSIYYLQECPQAKSYAIDIANKLKKITANCQENSRQQERTAFQLTSHFQSTQTKADYQKQFQKVIDYIHKGDCYQVNLTQEFSATCKGDGELAFRTLREFHPSPMSAFFRTQAFEILSLSPERFIRKAHNRISSFPIKGTRPRGASTEEDAAQINELQSSVKDRAENLMIVDLLRNDFGRICETGSVTTKMLFQIESFPNVHHLVSSIHGNLLTGIDLIKFFRATFPGGSITGAPKVRAMQIIEELEPHRRSIYCGAVIYLCGNGDMDSNIGIRTLLKKENTVRCWGGGGIVADSDCNNEYQETIDKIGRLMSLLEDHFGTMS